MCASPDTAAAPPRGGATFRALRHHNFRLFWSGQLVSLVGTWMQSTAQSWLVLQLVTRAYGADKSALYLGLVSAIGSLPTFLLTLLAGALADRGDKRRIVIATQAGAMLLALLLGLLTYTGYIRLWHVVVYAVLVGTVNAFDMPTRQSYVKELVGGEDLLNAIALNSSVFNAARIVGPAIAGWLMTIFGVAGIFLLNGASYLAVLAGLFRIRTPRHTAPTADRSLWQQLGEGFQYAWRNRAILLLLALMAVLTVFGFSYFVLMPVIAVQVLHLEEGGFGILFAFSGVGALAGALLLASTAGRAPKGALLCASGITAAVFLMLFSVSRVFSLSALFLMGISGGLVIASASINSLMQETAPDALRGRVVSMWIFIFGGFTPLGALYVGTVAHLGERVAMPALPLLVGGAVCLLAIAVISLRARWLWRLP